MKVVSLEQPCNQMEVISCVPNAFTGATYEARPTSMLKARHQHLLQGTLEGSQAASPNIDLGDSSRTSFETYSSEPRNCRSSPRGNICHAWYSGP